jgi:hypothetical protein
MRCAPFCENCGTKVQRCEPHHLRAKGMGGNGILEVRINLIALGSQKLFSCQCHRNLHDGLIDPRRLLRIVAIRERLRVEEIVEVLDLFRRLVKPTQRELELGLASLSLAGMKLAQRELSEAKWPGF